MVFIKYDVVIVGAGPAGLTAGIYLLRAGINIAVIERGTFGGQAALTYEVDNYPGFSKTVSGFDLMEEFHKQFEKFGGEILNKNVVSFDFSSDEKKAFLSNNEVISGRVFILAMGARAKMLNIEGEEKYKGLGVSYCATCDGAFFRERDVAVIGGGNTAAEDALFLSRICRKVYLIHRRQELRADKILVDRIKQTKNIEFLLDAIVEKFSGNDTLQSLTYRNVKTGNTCDLNVNGAFVAIGVLPNSEILKGKVELSKSGFVVTNERLITSVNGVLAAGDIRATVIRQIITSAADGAIAAYTSEQLILG